MAVTFSTAWARMPLKTRSNELFRRTVLKLGNGRFTQRIIIAGAGSKGKQVAEALLTGGNRNSYVIGFLDDSGLNGAEITSGKKILGKISDVKDIVSGYSPNQIIIALEDANLERMLDVIDLCRLKKMKVRIVSEDFRVVAESFPGKSYSGMYAVDVGPSSGSAVASMVKRTIDIAGSLAGILILSPFILLLVILIRLSSVGPVVFRQTRIGKNGKPFSFYKFRSMYTMDGEDEERKRMMLEFMRNNKPKTVDTKVINDKRVTWIGSFIRKTSLDELPQLYNVLKGDMSLVGPRPCLPYEYENYSSWQKRRVDVMPGCTGTWQVSGRSAVSFNESVLLDLYYVNNQSLLLDLKILLKTIPVMFFSKGGK